MNNLCFFMGKREGIRLDTKWYWQGQPFTLQLQANHFIFLYFSLCICKTGIITTHFSGFVLRIK